MHAVNRAAERRAVDAFGRAGAEIMRRHDPLFLIELGAPSDEYDCVVTGTMVELIGERDATVEAWLLNHFEDHFGVAADPTRVAAATHALVALWHSDDLAPLRP